MEVADEALSRPNRWALVLGTGLALYGIHWAEQPFLDYVFLPQIGLIIIVFCVGFYFMQHPQKPDLGSKYVWVPMLAIITSIIAWVFIDFSIRAVASAFYGISLFAVYLVSRQLGKAIFLVFIPFVVIIAISCIYNGIAHPGEITGGIITNYCASAGFMIFGTIVNKFKWQWILATLVLIALFFTGALEAVFILGVLGIVLLARKDWSKKLLLPIGLASVTITIMALSNLLIPLYNSNNILTVLHDLIIGKPSITVVNGDGSSKAIIDQITTNRWEVIQRAVNDIQPLGHGFSPSIDIVEASNNVHNVPLMMTDQIGPAAGLAWLFVTIFCLVRTKWKYAWTAVIAMSMFNHYLWTQFAPYWWALAGVSTASSLKSDLIFRK